MCMFSSPNSVKAVKVTVHVFVVCESKKNTRESTHFCLTLQFQEENRMWSSLPGMFSVCRHCHTDENDWKEHVQTEWVAAALSTQNTLSCRQTQTPTQCCHWALLRYSLNLRNFIVRHMTRNCGRSFQLPTRLMYNTKIIISFCLEGVCSPLFSYLIHKTTRTCTFSLIH